GGGRGGDVRPRGSGGAAHHLGDDRGDRAQPGGHQEGEQVGAGGRADRRRRPGRERGPHLVRGEDPAEDHRAAFPAEDLVRQGHRRRHGGDPVQAVDEDEPEQAQPAGAERRGQHQQRDAAQAVVPQQQPARVDPVGEPAGGKCAGHVEDADQRQQAGGGGLRDPVVVAGRDQVGADQAVRRGAADRERAGQQPERRAAGRLGQRPQRGADRVRRRGGGRGSRGGGGGTGGGGGGRAAGRAPDGGGSSPEERRRQRHPRAGARRDREGGPPPAVVHRQVGQQRQEHQLPGGAGGGER